MVSTHVPQDDKGYAETAWQGQGQVGHHTEKENRWRMDNVWLLGLIVVLDKHQQSVHSCLDVLCTEFGWTRFESYTDLPKDLRPAGMQSSCPNDGLGCLLHCMYEKFKRCTPNYS